MLIFVECIDLVKALGLKKINIVSNIYKHERTSKWLKDLYKFARELNDLYPFMCELCNEEGHFNFQCSYFNDTNISQFCDNMITSSLYDELNLFLGCEELSEKHFLVGW